MTRHAVLSRSVKGSVHHYLGLALRDEGPYSVLTT